MKKSIVDRVCFYLQHFIQILHIKCINNFKNEMCEMMLFEYQDKIKRTVTGDETWVKT